jgi:hypothetical protein
MTLAMNAQRELCLVQKASGVLIAVDDILRLVSMVSLCSIRKKLSHVSKGRRAEGEAAGCVRGRGAAGELERAPCRGSMMPPLFGTVWDVPSRQKMYVLLEGHGILMYRSWVPDVASIPILVRDTR